MGNTPSRTTSLLDPTLGQRLPLRLLLADDNLVNQRVGSRLLQQMGYQVDTALNGQEALDAVKNGAYDLVFMDVQMPVMDGLEATRRIRQHECESSPLNPRPTVIIAMTANAQREDRDRCLAAGMNDFIPKPVRLETIQAVIERWGTSALNKQSSLGLGTGSGGAFAKSESDASVKTPVDMSRLMQFAAGDWANLRDIMGVYLSQTAAQLAKMRAAVAAGNAAEVGATAHKCAGASATCGMNSLLPALRELERQGRAGQLNNAESLVDTATEAFAAAQNFLRQYLKENQVDLETPAA